MVDFRPFRAIRYTAKAGPMADLICPPYDVVSAQQERELLQRSPCNMVRLELAELSGPPSPERYAAAADTFHQLQTSGMLQRDEEPAYYVLRQRFPFAGGTLERFGLLGTLRLEELGAGVLPHEDTAPSPKKDRLALMQTTQANLSPIMMLYRDPSGHVGASCTDATAGEPLADFAVDDVAYTLWSITNAEMIEAVRSALASQPAYIADGHHRYETAIVYRDADAGSEQAASRYVMTCLIDFDDPGLLIRPYYRLVYGLGPNQLEKLKNLLERHFVSRPAGVEGAAELLEALVAAVGRDRIALGVVQPGHRPTVLTPADDGDTSADGEAPPADQVRSVEAFVLQEVLFRPIMGDSLEEHVAYIHDGQEVLDRLTRGDGQMGFFIKGVPPRVFETIVGAGIRLPRKSTYFYPKLPSGLVINPLSGIL